MKKKKKKKRSHKKGANDTKMKKETGKKDG
jgi:hypothetical protein